MRAPDSLFMRVFITGGTGLVGSHVASRLRSAGHEVVALRRPEADTEFLERIGCALVDGDVRDAPEDLGEHMAGCTHVLHAAALVYAGGAWPRIRAVNVDGTRNVLLAAAHAGVGHAVHLSSVAVYGSASGQVDERTPIDTPIPPTDLYARSKRESESVARTVERDEGLAVTILRPSAVYGERDRLMTLRLERLLRWPVAFLLGGGHNTLPTVYAGNVASAVTSAMEAARRETTWDVAMDEPLTQRDMLESLARGLGRSPRFIPIPGSWVTGGATVLQGLGVSAPGAEHLPLARVARLALADNPYPSHAIRRDLGWDPPYRHLEALERTGRWMRQALLD